MAELPRSLKQGMNRRKQLTIGIGLVLVFLSSMLLTTGLLWLKQRVSQEASATEPRADSSSSEAPLATVAEFQDEIRSSETPAIEAPSSFSSNQPEFVLAPILNDEK